MRREVLAFCLIGAGILVFIFTAYGWIPDPEPDAASGGPPEFALGVLFAIIAFVLPRAKPLAGLDRPVRIWRRSTAAFIDWYIAGFSIAAAFGLGGIAIFYIWPGAARDLPKQPLIIAALITVGVSAFFAYFWLHPKFGRATLGQYIMGYRIDNDPNPDVPPHHFMRTVAATFSACSWHLWIWFVNDRMTTPGVYWWDRIGQTRAVFVGPY